MKKKFLLSLLLIAFICGIAACQGDEPSKDPIKKMKGVILGEMFDEPGDIARATNDANRAETVSQLRQILGDSLADPRAKDSSQLAIGAMVDYAGVTKEDNLRLSPR